MVGERLGNGAERTLDGYHLISRVQVTNGSRRRTEARSISDLKAKRLINYNRENRKQFRTIIIVSDEHASLAVHPTVDGNNVRSKTGYFTLEQSAIPDDHICVAGFGYVTLLDDWNREKMRFQRKSVCKA